MNINQENEKSSMSNEEKKKAILKMRQNLEEQFVEMGQLLYEVKSNNFHSFFGYDTFNEFIEDEFNISGTFASKLINNYKFYLEKMNLDEHSFVKIGLEKLNQLRTVINKADRIEQENWLQKAENEKTTVLKEEIKEYKDKNKTKNLKDVFTDQFLERMITHFNCTRKELMFKLAIYFQDKNLEEIAVEIRNLQEKMKQENFNV